jgi:prophage regulatory protein
MRKMVRFAQLNAAGIVPNRTTLGRWSKDYGFPKPIELGPQSVAWYEDEVLDWIAQRKVEREAREAVRSAKGAAIRASAKAAA